VPVYVLFDAVLTANNEVAGERRPGPHLDLAVRP
jgi:hypothetical protein